MGNKAWVRLDTRGREGKAWVRMDSIEKEEKEGERLGKRV